MTQKADKHHDTILKLQERIVSLSKPPLAWPHMSNNLQQTIIDLGNIQGLAQEALSIAFSMQDTND